MILKDSDKSIILKMVSNMTLLEVRKLYNLSQQKVASFLNVPLRTYIRYEKDDNYGNSLKRKMMIESIDNEYRISEDRGVLSTKQIKDSLNQLFASKYEGKINFCYLFGSYAKGYQTETSDIDLCVSTPLTGLDFVGLSEDIRNILHKKIDLIRFDTLNNNLELIAEILKSGMKLYG